MVRNKLRPIFCLLTKWAIQCVVPNQPFSRRRHLFAVLTANSPGGATAIFVIKLNWDDLLCSRLGAICSEEYPPEYSVYTIEMVVSHPCWRWLNASRSAHPRRQKKLPLLPWLPSEMKYSSSADPRISNILAPPTLKDAWKILSLIRTFH